MKNFLIAVVIATASAAMFAQGQPVTVETMVVNNGPGEQTDPQISGNLVSYTQDLNGAVTIRYYDFSSGTDQSVPNSGELDFLSDVSAGRIVFTRTSIDTSVYLYDTTSSSAPAEVYPEDNAIRHVPSIGGDTVAWQDFTFGRTNANAEIMAYDLTSETRTRLTNDLLLDREIEVSPDGAVILWVKCNLSGTNCDVWKAVKSDLGWTVSQVTFSTGEESRPATDGDLVAYASLRDGERDIYYNRGGVETRLDILGDDRNPSLRDGIIVFEHMEVGNTTFDLMAFDVDTATLYRVTNTAGVSEILSDVWVQMDGLVRIVYAVNDGDFDIHALTFMLDRAAKTPDQQLTDLRDLVASMNLQHGLANSLTTKLDNVQAKLNAGDTNAACNQLNAFINECQAQSGKKLTAGEDGQAQQLINAAQQIRTDLACP